MRYILGVPCLLLAVATWPFALLHRLAWSVVDPNGDL